VEKVGEINYEKRIGINTLLILEVYSLNGFGP
jgi:hypothetical protein